MVVEEMERERKRKERSDEEEERPLKSIKKMSMPGSNLGKTLKKEIRGFRIFESKVNIMDIEDFQQQDLEDIKANVKRMLSTIQMLNEENESLKKNVAAPDSVEEKISKFEEAIKAATKTLMEIKKGDATKPLSYADKLKAPAVRITEEQKVPRGRHVVAVYPKEVSKAVDSSETKAVVMNTIAPAKERLQICGVRSIRNKGILIETRTKEDLERVLNSGKLGAAGLKVEIPSKKRPLLIIYGVQREAKDKELISAIKKQNLESFTGSMQPEDIAISHRTGDRNRDTANVVIQVSPQIREFLLRNERIYIGWESLRIKDYLIVSRCFKCQAFGHVAKYCKAKHDTCGHCAMDGHVFKDCPKKNQSPACANCKKAGKDSKHCSRANECPAYRRALANLMSRTDYGK
ncbi:hypothetical protein M0802_015461 [Mischocyttarus mexicanus]|nr:hypothetical protein M0802_015461 [Mischocyttarus mexicanus]